MKKTVKVELTTRFELAEGYPDLIYFVTGVHGTPEYNWIESKRKIREVHKWMGQIIASWDKPKKKGKRVSKASTVDATAHAPKAADKEDK